MNLKVCCKSTSFKKEISIWSQIARDFMIIIWDSDERFLSQNIENKINESGVYMGRVLLRWSNQLGLKQYPGDILVKSPVD